MDYYELHNYMTTKATREFRNRYRWDLSWDMEMDAADRGWHDPKKTIRLSIRKYLKNNPEEYNSIFEPFFSEEEITNMSQSLKEVA